MFLATSRTQGVRRMEPMPSAMGAQTLKHWTVREVLVWYLFLKHLKVTLSHLLSGILPVPCVYVLLGCLGSFFQCVGLLLGQEAKLWGHISNQDCVFSFNPSVGDSLKTQTSVISKRAGLQVQAFINARNSWRMLARSCQKIWHQIGLWGNNTVQASHFIQEVTEA